MKNPACERLLEQAAEQIAAARAALATGDAGTALLNTGSATSALHRFAEHLTPPTAPYVRNTAANLSSDKNP